MIFEHMNRLQVIIQHISFYDSLSFAQILLVLSQSRKLQPVGCLIACPNIQYEWERSKDRSEIELRKFNTVQ